MQTADVVVVGLGAAGSATLYHLARRGVRVIGVDRFVPPHPYGSTHGGSRIIRRAYFEGRMYAPLLSRAYELWTRLEGEAQAQLITRCGCLNIAHRDSAMIADAEASARAVGVAVTRMTPEDVRDAFPAYHLRSDEVALFEPDAGTILPERAVAAHLAQAQAHGAAVLTNDSALSWKSNAAGIAITTESRVLHAARMVVTAGAFIRDVLGRACPPVEIERVINAWYSTTAPIFRPQHFPTFIWEFKGVKSYGVPDLGRGMKAGLHYHGTLVDDLADLDRRIGDSETDALRKHLRQLFPRYLGPCAVATTCLYTNTPDKHYLIDYLGGTDTRVVVGSACSGHGFKASAAIGEALADLAMDQSPRTPIGAFRWRWP